MSIDFDSAALQTQHDEEEYDQEDYAREQELHQLLTDLPDDMLEDSRDSSSPELECSTCSNKNTGSSPQSNLTQQWSDCARPTSHTQNHEGDYDQSSHNDYVAENGDAHIGRHQSHPQTQPLPHTWNKNHQFAQDYTCTSMGTETSDFSADFDSKPYPEGNDNHMEYDGQGGYMNEQCNGGHNTRNHFQNLKSEPKGQGVNQHKAMYNPHHPAHLQKMFKSQAIQQEGQFDRLQREFLDSTQSNPDKERLVQVQILNKAQQRQIEDLERKLEDSRRNMRYLEHQFAIVKDEKDGLSVSLKESIRSIEEANDREVQMQNKIKAMAQQVQVLNQKDQENMKKQRIADAAVDSMKQQVLELCRSDTLSRTREQHDRDLAIMKEQHDAALLALQQKLDATAQALSEQVDIDEKLREHVKLLEHQREEEQLERARVVNALTERLEESQRQCGKLLHTNSVQEMAQLEVKLQQAQSARELSENMNKALQEDMADLKEQITLYESAVKHGVIALDLGSDWENHLSESCVDLGLKKTNRKNGTLHSTALAHLSDSKLPKDEALRLLQQEMQRCLGCLKGKRQKIIRLQEELQHHQAQINELQTGLDEAKLNSSAKEMSHMKHLDLTVDSQKELKRLSEDKQHLQEQVEVLEKKNRELKQSEEKLKAINSELCTKMREMIHELDQEKQEAAQRYERINQQYRDDVVNRVRTELMVEHEAQVEQMTALYQQQVQQLQNQLSEASDKVLAVQECYISVCKEKSLLEEKICNSERGDAQMQEGSGTALEMLRTELEEKHQASIMQLKAVWSKEKETEIQKQVDSHVASVQAQWKEKVIKIEKTWVQRLEEAKKKRQREMVEMSCQTDDTTASRMTIPVEELESRLSAQKQQLQLEADKTRHKAVEEARKRVQRELQDKHLEDIAKQVEGAVTRAYNRWIEDLSSLPEYQSSLQTEKEKWEASQEKLIEQRVSQAVKEAEKQQDHMHKNQLEDHRSGAQRVNELQEELAVLKSQLEQVTKEQATLLKAELAAARAAWNRDKQKEISILQHRSEEAYQFRLQEQRKKQEQSVQQVREDADLQRKELLVQVEAKLKHTVKAREEEWRCLYAEKELTQKQQMRDEFLAELQSVLAEVHTQLLRTPETSQQDTENSRTSGSNSCRDLVKRAVSEAHKEWKKMSEEKLSQVLKETLEQHEREINKMQSSLSQKKEQPRCKKECTESVSKLKKKNQELQRHLEKACRQLQHSIREHKTAMRHIKDEHENSLRKAKEEHLQQLEEVKRTKETSNCGSSDHQQKLQQGLEEMKAQYLLAVENIRGDMLRYLQESRERAAEIIRIEVQRERQDTARKMRRYYLTCLQELLEDGGKITGAEKKIMNAASKLAAMAKVLETPVKSKSGKNYGLPRCSAAVFTAAAGGLPGKDAAFSNTLSALTELPDFRPGEKSLRNKTSADSMQKSAAEVRTKLLCHQDPPSSQESSGEAGMKPQTSYTQFPSCNPSNHTTSQTCMDFISVTDNRKDFQGGDLSKAEAKPFVILEAPVRDEKQTDWSMASCDSNAGLQVPRLSYLGRRVESVRPFSVSAASIHETGDFSSFTTDRSDLTVYNEIPKTLPQSETFSQAKKSANREPTPGSECDSQQGVCSRPLFSEQRQRQQDSGFDSPFLQQK